MSTNDVLNLSFAGLWLMPLILICFQCTDHLIFLLFNWPIFLFLHTSIALFMFLPSFSSYPSFLFILYMLLLSFVSSPPFSRFLSVLFSFPYPLFDFLFFSPSSSFSFLIIPFSLLSSSFFPSPSLSLPFPHPFYLFP